MQLCWAVIRASRSSWTLLFPGVLAFGAHLLTADSHGISWNVMELTHLIVLSLLGLRTSNETSIEHQTLARLGSGSLQWTKIECPELHKLLTFPWMNFVQTAGFYFHVFRHVTKLSGSHIGYSTVIAKATNDQPIRPWWQTFERLYPSLPAGLSLKRQITHKMKSQCLQIWGNNQKSSKIPTP